jgi:hypothetical protein
MCFIRYSEKKAKMVEIIHEWGGPLSSIISVDRKGQCIDFIYENTVVPTPGDYLSWDYNIDGHILTIENAMDKVPDGMSVTPLPGWEAVTELSVVAPDWATTVITICQQLLG